jgi:hypothetical protein
VRLLALFGVVVLAACATAGQNSTPPPFILQPYFTLTPAPSPTLPAPILVTAAAPLASPTPFSYTIRAGDTLGEIADLFHVSLDAILHANPGLDPNALPLGQVVRIPSRTENTSSQASPTPVPVAVPQAACHGTADGNLWCFILFRNDSGQLEENLTAQITLAGAGGEPLASQTAVLPLDVLTAGGSLPMAVFFEGAAGAPAAPRVQILTSNYVAADDARYLHASIGNTLVDVYWSGLVAEVSGQVLLPADSPAASSIWVVGVAYSETGEVVGMRRWEASAGLDAGRGLPFSFLLSSVAGRIDHVDIAVEARP